MEQHLLEFAPDPQRAGFRLHSCSVFNWGGFHGRVHQFAPEGRASLLTGGNGCGKTTLADALLTLLVPSRKRNYNVAARQEGRADRQEKDYILGAYSEQHDATSGRNRKLYLRKGEATYTVLLALFHHETFNRWVTLAQVLWINGSGGVEKIFIVETRKLTIEAEFQFATLTGLRRTLRDRGVTLYDNFTKYSEAFHRELFLPVEKAPMEIFNQAVCVKDIGDLTGFIRDYMLDSGSAADKLENLRKNFRDLRASYEGIAKAKRQLEHLRELEKEHQIVLDLQKKEDEVREQLEAVPAFFAEEENTLREIEAERLTTKQALLQADIAGADEQIRSLEQRQETLEVALRGSEEGRRLAAIERELQGLTQEKDRRREKRQEFDAILRNWGGNLSVAKADEFEALLTSLEQDMADMAGDLERMETERQEVAIRKRDMAKDRDVLEKEERQLLARPSNIPPENLEARQFLLEELDLTEDDLPFIGEIMRVKPDEERWRGSIERLARGFALCLAVPPKLVERVDAFVHSRRQRGLLVYHAVPERPRQAYHNVSPNSVARKLDVRAQNPAVAAWLEVELTHRFDHECCEDTGPAFRKADSAITLTGLTKQRGSERRKDDRFDLTDARRWVLGWDNQEKLVAIKKRLAEINGAIQEVDAAHKTQRERLKELTARRDAGSKLSVFRRYEDIDFESVARRVDDLQFEKSTLQGASAKLRELEQQLKALKHEKTECLAGLDKLKKAVGGIEKEQEQNASAQAVCQSLLAAAEAGWKRDGRIREDFLAWYPVIEGCFEDKTYGKGIGFLQLRRDYARSVLTGRNNTLIEELCKKSTGLKRDMQDFIRAPENIEHQDALYFDGSAMDYDSVWFDPFASLRKHLEEEDLPKNEARFKEKLHSDVIGDISGFDMYLDNLAESIENRMRGLNIHLSQIDYDRKEHTYIQIVPRRVTEDDLRRFHLLRHKAIEDSLQYEDRMEKLHAKYLRVQEFHDALDEDERWTEKVIDVRNWFDFRAEEYWRETHQVRQSYEGSGGKSGGEKNRLASTILATSIAYQYGISVANNQSETFRLVMVDEMFSKTDNAFSAYLIELYRQFGLQILMIHPLDEKLHLAQKYVEKYHVVTKNRDHLSSVRTMTVEEFKDASGR